MAFLQFPGVMEVVAAPTLQPGGLGASLEVGPEFRFAEFEVAKFPSMMIGHAALENTPVAAPLRREAAEFLAQPLATRAATTAAFRTLAHFDAFTRARRAILAELRELVSLGAAPGRTRAWDPRLQEVVDAAAQLDATWRAFGVAPDPLVCRFAARLNAKAQVMEILGTPAGADEQTAAGLAAQELGARLTEFRTWEGLALIRAAHCCAEVAEHCHRVLGRARDEGIRARYRRLGALCRDIAEAVDVLAAR